MNYVKVFRIVPKNEDTQYWVKNALDMDEPKRKDMASKSWTPRLWSFVKKPKILKNTKRMKANANVFYALN